MSAFLQPRIHYEVLEGVQHATMVTGEKARDKVIGIVASINKPPPSDSGMVWERRRGGLVGRRGELLHFPALYYG